MVSVALVGAGHGGIGRIGKRLGRIGRCRSRGIGRIGWRLGRNGRRRSNGQMSTVTTPRPARTVATTCQTRPEASVAVSNLEPVLRLALLDIALPELDAVFCRTHGL